MTAENSALSNERAARFAAAAAELSLSFEGEIRVGGHYVGVVEDGDLAYVSGQIPRVGDAIAVTGRVGAEASLDDARRAARICTLRALALLARLPGGLGRVRRVLRMTAYTQSASTFTQQSEVADAASDLLHAIFGDAGAHARTSVGVAQLPKNAAVELDLIVALHAEKPSHGDRT